MADLLSLVASLAVDATGADASILKTTNKFIKLAELVATPIKMVVNVAWDFGKDVLDTGLEYEKNVQAVFALTQATDDAAKSLFEQEVIAQAAASTFTTAQVAAAGTYEALGGWDLSETTAGLHGIVVTAEAAGEDLESVSEIIVPLTNAFHVGSDQAMHFGDVLTAAATDSSTDILQIGHAMKYVAPIAAALGYTLDDTAVLLELLGDNAIVSGMAGRSLRNMFTRLATDAGATTNKLGALGTMADRLGVNFYTSEGKARPLLDWFGEMREQWQGLDKDTRESIEAQMSSVDMASDTIAADIDRITELNHAIKHERGRGNEAEAAKYEAELAAIFDPYKDILEELKKQKPELNLHDAQTEIEQLYILQATLGKLGQKEQIAYAKQIGNMQGVAAVLALMNASAEDYEKALASIQNSEGAADKMREQRLDGLWGDLARFNSEYNALKTEIFLGAKEPLREIVKIGTSALTSIREAIEKGGLEEGIKELANQIRSKKRLLAPILESIGETAGPLVGSLLKTLIDDALPTIITLGSTLGEAIFTGIGNALTTSDKPFTKLLGLLNIFGGKGIGLVGGAVGGTNNLWDILTGKGTLWEGIPDIEVGVDKEYLKQSIDKAIAEQKPLIDIGIGKILNIGEAQRLLAMLEGEEYNPSEESKQFDGTINAENVNLSIGEGAGKSGDSVYDFLNGLFPDMTPKNPFSIFADEWKKSFAEDTTEAVESGITEGATGGTTEAEKILSDSSTTISDDLAEKISDGGTDGAAEAAVNAEDILSTSNTTISDDLVTKIGDAGTPAAKEFAKNFQNEAYKHRFNWRGDISIDTLPFTHNARAMSTGRIFDHPTIFGYADGALQMAGDAGPEAVVGVNSLHSMITGAVASAMSTFQPVHHSERPINVVFELEGAQKWIYRLNKAEEQRVGLKLSTGGSY